MKKRFITTNLKQYKQYTLHISVFAMALFFCILGAASLRFTGHDTRTRLLDIFCAAAKSGTKSTLDYFMSSVLSNFGIIFIIFFMGLCAVGIPVIYAAIFLKSYSIGFVLGFIYYSFSFRGFLISFFALGVPMLLCLSVCILFSFRASELSLHLFSLLGKRRTPQYNIKKYLKLFFTYSSLLIICVLYDTFITPALLKIFIP